LEIIGMNSKTLQRCNEIKSKVKSRFGYNLGKPEFSSNDQVVEMAIETLYQQLKEQGLI